MSGVNPWVTTMAHMSYVAHPLTLTLPHMDSNGHQRKWIGKRGGSKRGDGRCALIGGGGNVGETTERVLLVACRMVTRWMMSPHMWVGSSQGCVGTKMVLRSG